MYMYVQQLRQTDHWCSYCWDLGYCYFCCLSDPSQITKTTTFEYTTCQIQLQPQQHQRRTARNCLQCDSCCYKYYILFKFISVWVQVNFPLFRTRKCAEACTRVGRVVCTVYLIHVLLLLLLDHRNLLTT